MNFKVGMISLGCDKNRIDAEIMLSILSKEGYEIVSDEKKADVIIVNTCGFIESAKAESIDTILQMSENKDTGICKSVIVTGCLAERYKDELINEMPEINAVVGTGNYRAICNIVKETLEGKDKIVNIGNIDYSFDNDNEDRIITTPKHYAYIKIAEGCDNNCTYCIIPQLRGKFRSKKLENIINEATKLVQSGVKEIILVAQDTTMYGKDIYGEKMLPKLLKELEKIEDLEWIRLMYTYPEEITDELIQTIKESKKICHYLDMPIQHVSNSILHSMKRMSTQQHLYLLIDKIRHEIPDIKIRTSIIVGFPGETDADYKELSSFIQNYKLDRVGIFTYSAEEGTVAAKMENQVAENIKVKRKDDLMKIQSKISLEKNKMLIGEKLSIIIEGMSKENKYYGRSYGDAPEIDQTIFVENFSDKIEIGSIVQVLITRAYTYDLVGDVYYEFSK
jgi:ribosomal protein S12 methylthiotransferase